MLRENCFPSCCVLHFVHLFDSFVISFIPFYFLGVRRFCLEQPTSPRHLSRRKKDGGRGCQNGLHAFLWRAELLWHSELPYVFTKSVCTSLKMNMRTRENVFFSALSRLRQVELRAYWWPAKRTETWHMNVVSNTRKCKMALICRRYCQKKGPCQGLFLMLPVISSANIIRLSFLQSRTSERPCSLWQSSSLLWHEACSHSPRQENHESGCEGESTVHEDMLRLTSSAQSFTYCFFHFKGDEESHHKEYRHACMFSTSVSSWSHWSHWGSGQGQKTNISPMNNYSNK